MEFPTEEYYDDEEEQPEEEYDEEYEDEDYEEEEYYRDERAELMLIRVEEPVEILGRVYYKVSGYDRLGRYETRRRYNDFYSLFTVFRDRLPGLYIPSLPPKKIIGNTKHEFLEERSFHLE